MARIFNYMPYIFYCCISLKNKKVKPLKFNVPIACYVLKRTVFFILIRRIKRIIIKTWRR